MRRREALAAFLGGTIHAGEPRRAAIVLDIASGRVLDSLNESFVTRWITSPGSAIKPFSIHALIDAGKLKKEEAFPCPGRLVIAGRQLACSHPVSALPFDARLAIAYSCNYYTARVAARFRSGELADALRSFGFHEGVKTAQAGDETRLQAMGEASIEVTPAEMVHGYARLAKTRVAAIREGLEDAVEFGTAQRAGLAGLRVAGKTGSVRTASGLRAAWFCGYAPSRSPEVAIAVLVQGRSGGADAAPVAAEILEQWRHGHRP
jgi:penicillin-binding protein 2